MKTVKFWLVQISVLMILMMYKPVVFEVNGQAIEKTEVRWVSYADAVEDGQVGQKKLMIFLEADWCTVCKRMHREVFTDNSVIALLNTHFYPVRLDIESNDKIPMKGRMITKKEFSKSVGVYGTPTILFLNNEEDIIGNFVGYSDEKDMIRLLNYIKSDAYLTVSLEGYSNP